ncbi:MAG: hypothetical protein RL095_123 [Verrucomicrobiota bacterium]|jgi:hypothetical protein
MQLHISSRRIAEPRSAPSSSFHLKEGGEIASGSFAGEGRCRFTLSLHEGRPLFELESGEAEIQGVKLAPGRHKLVSGQQLEVDGLALSVSILHPEAKRSRFGFFTLAAFAVVLAILALQLFVPAWLQQRADNGTGLKRRILLDAVAGLIDEKRKQVAEIPSGLSASRVGMLKDLKAELDAIGIEIRQNPDRMSNADLRKIRDSLGRYDAIRAQLIENPAIDLIPRLDPSLAVSAALAP